MERNLAGHPPYLWFLTLTWCLCKRKYWFINSFEWRRISDDIQSDYELLINSSKNRIILKYLPSSLSKHDQQKHKITHKILKAKRTINEL